MKREIIAAPVEKEGSVEKRPLRILLVAKEGEACNAYVAALERLGVTCDVAASFKDVPQLAVKKTYNGLLLDIITLVRSRSETEKKIAYECINFYPSTRIKWNAAHKRIDLLSFEQAASTGSETALQTFVEQQCRPFFGRMLRNSTRKEMVLNVRLAREPDSFPENGERTFTVNISRCGAFIQTVQEYAEGETVWLCFEELFARAPVSAEIRWRQPWGVRRAIPGIGVLFKLTEEQAGVLKRILKG